MPLGAHLTLTKHRGDLDIIGGSPLSFTKPGFHIHSSDLNIIDHITVLALNALLRTPLKGIW